MYLVTFAFGTEFWKTQVHIFDIQLQYSDAFRIVVYGKCHPRSNTLLLFYQLPYLRRLATIEHSI